MSECPFCERISSADDVYATTEFAVAFPDGFPVSDGHTLVVPKRHVARAEQLERAEWLGLFDLVREVSRELSTLPRVEGVNVGINSGEGRRPDGRPRPRPRDPAPAGGCRGPARRHPVGDSRAGRLLDDQGGEA